MTPENPIIELIDKYKPLKEKYQLPEFSKMNELFDIEDIDPESEFILRKIRRTIADKIANYLRFTEIIINPSNAPMFFFKLLKRLTSEDKEGLSKIYESLGNAELKMLSLDVEYNEELLKNCYEKTTHHKVKTLTQHNEQIVNNDIFNGKYLTDKSQFKEYFGENINEMFEGIYK